MRCVNHGWPHHLFPCNSAHRAAPSSRWYLLLIIDPWLPGLLRSSSTRRGPCLSNLMLQNIGRDECHWKEWTANLKKTFFCFDWIADQFHCGVVVSAHVSHWVNPQLESKLSCYLCSDKLLESLSSWLWISLREKINGLQSAIFHILAVLFVHFLWFLGLTLGAPFVSFQ